MFRFARLSQFVLLCGVLPAAVSFGSEKADGKSDRSVHFTPGADSYRASFNLGVPRRFATRYLSESRTLEIKVVPGNAAEFDASRFYDTRYIHRVLVRESRGEVTLSVQLKNAPVAWYVGHQSNPWRIVLDIWRTEPKQAHSIEEEWAWQEDANGLGHSAQSPAAISVPDIQSSVYSKAAEIDLPDNSNQEKPISGPSERQRAGVIVSNGEPPFPRVESVLTINTKQASDLERKLNSLPSGPAQFDGIERLATTLYRGAQHAKAVSMLRRLAAIDPNRFADSPRLLWMAGESAFLGSKFALANDYLQTLRGKFNGHELASLAELRLLDMKLLKSDLNLSPDLTERYTAVSLNERAPWSARIGASVRLLAPVIDARPESAGVYQAAIQNCIKGNYVSVELKKECAYLQTKYSASQTDVVSADAALQRFKSKYPNDTRALDLEKQLNQRVRSNLKVLMDDKNFLAIAELEKSARPSLMKFTLDEPNLVLARVEGWLAAGDEGKALSLLQQFVSKTSDETRRSEALALQAKIFYKRKKTRSAEKALERILQSSVRKSNGLTDKAIDSVRECATAPYSSKTAQLILIDELKVGRYVERELDVLVSVANGTRGRGDSDKIYELILTTPPRNNEEAKKVEESLFIYADDLRGEGRLAKSAEIFMAVANLAQSSRKAESAYKAGIMYARAGLIEKAKSAWQLSAADISDKKFSSLANERLERIR